MEKKNELNVTALLQLLQHVGNMAETRLTGTSAANAANWLTLINCNLRAAIRETERAARHLNTRMYINNDITNNTNITNL